MLSNVPSLARHLQLTQQEETDESDSLAQYLAGADAAIKKYLHREIESATYTEYLSGNGMADLNLRQRPVSSITSLSVDQAGAWGQSSNPFPSTTLQTSGTDYALVKDGNGVSESGMVRRLGSTVSGWGFNAYYGRGTLSGWDRSAVWPVGDGNIKVVYVAGYTSVPKDLETACNVLCAQIRAMAPTGRPLASENYIDYAYTLLATSDKLELSELRSILAPWVEPVI